MKEMDFGFSKSDIFANHPAYTKMEEIVPGISMTTSGNISVLSLQKLTKKNKMIPKIIPHNIQNLFYLILLSNQTKFDKIAVYIYNFINQTEILRILVSIKIKIYNSEINKL